MTEAVISGAQKAKKQHRIQCNFLANFVVNGLGEMLNERVGINLDNFFHLVEGPERAMKCLDELKPFIHNGVMGIGLSGNALQYSIQDFSKVFSRAKKL